MQLSKVRLSGFLFVSGMCLWLSSLVFADVVPPRLKVPTRRANPATPTPTEPAKKPASANPASPRKANPSSKKKGLDLPALKTKLQAIVKRWNLPGVGVVIVNKDKTLWAGGVGYANVKKKLPVTLDTQFRIGSISKSFLALAVLKLVEDGKVKLDAKVRDLVPSVKFHNPWAKTHPLRLVHLLEHTSGFDDMHFNELYHYGKTPLTPLAKSLSVNPRSRRIRWKPGHYVAYSNPGYTVAGAIVEKVSGKPADVYIREAILKPMGITVGSFKLNAAIKARLAQGYKGKPVMNWGGKKSKKSKKSKTKKSKVAKKKKKNKKKLSKTEKAMRMLILKLKAVKYPNIYHWPAGSMHASPREMGRFLRFMLRRGRSVVGDKVVLKPSSITRMESPKSALHVRHGLKVGYGLASIPGYARGYTSFGHNGGIDGFISSARYLPKQGLGYGVFLHCSGFGKPLKEISKAIQNAVLGHLPPPKKTRVKLSKEQLQKFVGKYRNTYMRNQVFDFLKAFAWAKVSVEKDYLVLQNLGFVVWKKKKKKLIPVGKNIFRLEKDEGPSIGFGPNDQGKMSMFVRGIGGTLVRDAGLHPQVTWLLLLLWLLVSAATGIFSLVWMSLKVFGGMKERPPYLRLRVYPFLALVSLVLAFLILNGRSLETLITPNFFTVGFFVLTLLYATFSVYSLGVLVRSFKVEGISLAVRLWAVAAVVANLGMMMFLWPVIGLRFWSF